MDPATIYAITVTLVGIGLPPKVDVEPLPPQWTMADCIKDHEKKLAGKPNTMARCVSRERPFQPSAPEIHQQSIWVISIADDANAALKTSASYFPLTMFQCQMKREREDGHVFCVRSPTKPETKCLPDRGICVVQPG